MTSKKNFVIRIDNKTYKALEKWASDEFRSVNSQIEWILGKTLKEVGRKENKDRSSKANNNKKS